MNSPIVWPGENNPIAAISFLLMIGFDSGGQPMYSRGIVASTEEREMVQAILEPLRPVPHSITSVAMGEVTIKLEDGNEIKLRPVFRPSLDTYQDLFFVEEWQFPMPAKLVELLELWRRKGIPCL